MVCKSTLSTWTTENGMLKKAPIHVPGRVQSANGMTWEADVSRNWLWWPALWTHFTRSHFSLSNMDQEFYQTFSYCQSNDPLKLLCTKRELMAHPGLPPTDNNIKVLILETFLLNVFCRCWTTNIVMWPCKLYCFHYGLFAYFGDPS